MIACIRLLDFHAKCSVHAGLAICYCLYAEDFRGSVCRRRRDVSFRARRRIFFCKAASVGGLFHNPGSRGVSLAASSAAAFLNLRCTSSKGSSTERLILTRCHVSERILRRYYLPSHSSMLEKTGLGTPSLAITKVCRARAIRPLPSEKGWILLVKKVKIIRNAVDILVRHDRNHL